MTVRANVVKADSEQVTAAVTGLKNDVTYAVSIVAKNDVLVSAPSNVVECTPHLPPYPEPQPAAMPVEGGRYWADEGYHYQIFNAEGSPYGAMRTEAGIGIECEVLMVGAGGAGKGQTVAFGKGGDGGGGELIVTTLPSANKAGPVTIVVPKGGTYNTDSPANAILTEGTTQLVARSGKSATDKNDAAGYPKTEVPVSWQGLSEFRWMVPGSHYVGGVADIGEQNFPNATFDGQGGSGTKDSRPGKGGDGYVAVRWKK